jgi:hypothetical protein
MTSSDSPHYANGPKKARPTYILETKDDLRKAFDALREWKPVKRLLFYTHGEPGVLFDIAFAVVMSLSVKIRGSLPVIPDTLTNRCFTTIIWGKRREPKRRSFGASSRRRMKSGK